MMTVGQTPWGVGERESSLLPLCRMNWVLLQTSSAPKPAPTGSSPMSGRCAAFGVSELIPNLMELDVQKPQSPGKVQMDWGFVDTDI